MDTLRSVRPSWGLALLPLLVLTNPVTAQAQDTVNLLRPPPTVEVLVQQIQAGEVRWLSPFLRQVRQERSQQELDLLSDSLLEILRTDPDPDGNHRIRREIVSHIAQAVTPHRGVPFPRGASLLRTIYEEIDHVPIQSSALGYYALVAPPGQALTLLRDAISTSDVRAVTAARILWEDMGQAGIVVLRDAWCDDLIRSPGARRLARDYSNTGALDCPREK